MGGRHPLPTGSQGGLEEKNERDVRAGTDLSQQAEDCGAPPASPQSPQLPLPFTEWPKGQPWAECNHRLSSPLGHGMEGSALALLEASRAWSWAKASVTMSLGSAGCRWAGKDTGLSSGCKKPPPRSVKVWRQPQPVEMTLWEVRCCEAHRRHGDTAAVCSGHAEQRCALRGAGWGHRWSGRGLG